MNLQEIYNIVFNGEKIKIEESTLQKVSDCYAFLEEFKRDKVIYGINTGFGPMAQYRVDDAELLALQYNIIRSHACGVGNPLQEKAVKAAMVSRLMTFLQCRSGIHTDVVKQITFFINNNIIPVIPEHGSVGASGDLVQLAHMALAFIGEGEVFYKNERRKASDVLAELGLKNLTLHGRDGLSLVNGTATMTGISIVNLYYAKRLLDWQLLASVMMNEIAGSYDDFLSEESNSVRRQYGQQEIAKAMREIAGKSQCLHKREIELYNGNNETKFGRKVQPYYSLRCVPQILGPILEEIRNAERVVENEVNSADDNPIVDPEAKNVFHGGNFHGDYISYEMDKLKIGITKLTMLAERQLNYLYHDKVNEILPPFVNLGRLGLDYGMQACQFTATSTTAENQTLSMPMSIHTIPNNNDNQDIVSMGTNAASMTMRVIENAYQVEAIHFMSIAQAIDCLQLSDKLSPLSQEIFYNLRSIFPVFKDDKPKSLDIERVIKYLKATELNLLK